MQWAQRQRLQFIEQQLFWEGRVNRGDIAEVFGVSIVQASKDLRTYRELLPGNVIYDGTAKSYQPSSSFNPRLVQPSPEQYLLERSAANLYAETMPLIGRNIDPFILREMVRSVTDNTPIRIIYQSLTRPHPFARTIRPHTFISNGRRWHVRAFCGETREFRDFLLARIFETATAENDPAMKSRSDDIYWNNEVQVLLGAHPGLTREQQTVIERDYGMSNGEVSISLRQAYLPYFLRHLNLVVETGRAREQQVTILNREDVDRWFQEVMPGKDREEGG